MGTVPNPRTWIHEEIPPYDTLKAEVYDTVSWLLRPPMVKLRQTVSQSIPNATFTALTFTTEDIDPYNWHNSVTNTSRVTPTFPGWYRGWFAIGFSGATAGVNRVGYARKNGNTSRSRRDGRAPVQAYNRVMRGIPFFMTFNGTTDYVEAMAYQDTGSSMSTQVGVIHQAELFLRWWGPL